MKRKATKKKESVVVFGAGGHAKVIVDILEQMGKFRIAALVAPNGAGTKVMGYPVVAAIPKGVKAGVIGIGDNFRRSQVAEEIPGFRFVAAVHPSAILGRGVEIGAGTVVMAGAVINPETKIGKHCIVNTRASIDHDCTLGDFASVGPGSTLGGKVKLGSFTAFGLGANCIHEITIGEHSVIGAGAAVVENIPALSVAYGNPCKVARKRNPGDPYYTKSATKR